jgi:HAD superfamily hydrolase (TIGR01509 family)
VPKLVAVDAVVFDMDGTLLDSSRTVPAAYAAAIFELCGRDCTSAEIIAAYSAGPAGHLIARFTGRPSTAADIDCWHRHLETRLPLTTVYDGIPDALDALREAGVLLGVFTAATAQAARMQLEHAGLADRFNVVVGGDEVPQVKPAPDGLVAAAERLGVSPQRTAYVGDAPNDLRCARAAGALPVAAGWGHLYEHDTDGDLCAPSPSELIELLAAVRH